jgi:hypothetical protein
MFLTDASTDSRRIAGVTSYGLFTRKDINIFVESTFGEIGADTRVSRFAGWIDAVLGGAVAPTRFGERFFGGLGGLLSAGTPLPVSVQIAADTYFTRFEDSGPVIERPDSADNTSTPAPQSEPGFSVNSRGEVGSPLTGGVPVPSVRSSALWLRAVDEFFADEPNREEPLLGEKGLLDG